MFTEKLKNIQSVNTKCIIKSKFDVRISERVRTVHKF